MPTYFQWKIVKHTFVHTDPPRIVVIESWGECGSQGDGPSSANGGCDWSEGRRPEAFHVRVSCVVHCRRESSPAVFSNS